MSAIDQAVPFDFDAVGVTANGVGYYLKGGRCMVCGKTFFPKRDLCPVCFDQGTIEEMKLSPIGTIVTYTVIRRAPDRKVPYAQGYVQTLEGLLVFAPLEARDLDSLRAGMAVKCIFKETDGGDGKRLIVYEFRPANEVNREGETI